MLPAWLGTDEGFKQHMEGKDLHVLKEMISEWPFFQTQLGMLEMVLSKVDADIASHYDQVLVEDKLRGFGTEFAERMQSLVQNILDITQQSSLLERQPSIKRSLELRNPYTDPLHFLQIELMSRCRQDAEGVHPTVDKALMVTIAGIAASMRNTG
jgi:phosphoenolpyruvate carboxylase